LTIDAAIAAGAFFGQPRRMNPATSTPIHGRRRVSKVSLDRGQEHFYLENKLPSQSRRQGEMTIHHSTQHPSEVQAMVRRCWVCHSTM